MPVFKKGDKSLAANYRPISFTYILFKVLEHILASNIVKHLDAQGIIHACEGLRAVEDVLKPTSSLLATDRYEAVVLV